MTARPVVAQFRARPEPIRLGESGDGVLTLRVQMPEVWDAVLVEAPPTEPVVTVKTRALQALFPEAQYHDDFVVKLNGFEVLDEHAPLAEVGARDGSTLLVTHRRRRPVR